MEVSFPDLVSILVVFISLLLATFFITTQSENKSSNKLMAGFLFFSTIDAAPAVLMDSMYLVAPGWTLLLSTTVLFKIPLIYLYVQSVIYSDFSLKRHDLIHLLPYILITLIFVPRFYLVEYEAKMQFLTVWFRDYLELKISYAIIHLQIFIYLIFAFLSVRRYRNILLENYSDQSKFNYTWLLQFLSLLVINALIASAKNVFLFLNIIDIHQYSTIAGQLLFLFFVCWIFWKALKYPQLFKGVRSDIKLTKQLVNVPSRVEETPSTQQVGEIQELKSYMNEKKPYLDPMLTVESLAQRLEIFPRELSVLINHHLHQHFFDFVNSYRIEKAMDLISNSVDEKLTFLEVLYQVGFNSKSSFNSAFKKHTGTTPTQYRKSLQSAA